MSTLDPNLSDFEIINDSPPTTPGNSPIPETSTQETPTHRNPSPEPPKSTVPPTPQEPTITKADLEKLYTFSTTLTNQHNLALQTIRTHEIEKFLLYPTIKDLIAKQDVLLALCTRLAKAHSLDEPAGIPEEGILSYMLDCIENLQRPLDVIGEKIERVGGEIGERIEERVDELNENMGDFEDHVVDHVVRVEMLVDKKERASGTADSLGQSTEKMEKKSESKKEEMILGLCREILGRVTYLENALLHDSDSDVGFVHHHQEGILGYLSDEIFNMVNQVDNFECSLQGIVDGLEETLQDFIEGPLDDIITGKDSVLRPNGDSTLPESSKNLKIQTDIRKQLSEVERSLKSTISNFQETINQRLDDLEGRVESLGTLKPSKETMSAFEKDMLTSTFSGGRGPSEPPASLFSFGPSRASSKSNTIFPETPRSPLRSHQSRNKPLSPKPVSPVKPQNPPVNLLPTARFPTSNPSEQQTPTEKKQIISLCTKGPSECDTTLKDETLFKYANMPPKNTTQKPLPPFIPPSKSTPSPQSTQSTPKLHLLLHQPTSPPSDPTDQTNSQNSTPKNPLNNPTDSPLARKMKSLGERKKKAVRAENNPLIMTNSMTMDSTPTTTTTPTRPNHNLTVHQPTPPTTPPPNTLNTENQSPHNGEPESFSTTLFGNRYFA